LENNGIPQIPHIESHLNPNQSLGFMGWIVIAMRHFHKSEEHAMFQI